MDISYVSVLLLLIIVNVESIQRWRRNTGWLVGTKPPGTVCSLNPCVQGIPICHNGGRCTVDEDTCNILCVCTDEYEGSLCEIPKPLGATDSMISRTSVSPIVTTLKPLAGRECTTGFVCIHGVCDQEKKKIGMFSCICDLQWSGDFCSRYIPTTRNTVLLPTTQSFQETTAATIITERDLSARTCVPGFVCQFGICDPEGKEKFQFRCLCDAGWTGVFCESKICDLVCEFDEICNVKYDNSLTCEKAANHITSNVTNGNPDEDQDTSVTNLGRVNDSYVCSDNDIKRPESERRCLPNLICTYGRCVDLECICDKGGFGMLCESRCCLDCGFNGTCRLLSNGTEYCDCPVTRTGPLCELAKPVHSTPEDKWYLYVVGACVGIIVLMLVLLIIVPYWMWRNRVTFIMRIVHYFQSYEDEDERLYDAFISYKSAKVDEHFVVNTLYPKLEQEMGFKLCMHFRDFVPGDTISNNIINAVNNSRRTILLLSPRYIESDWTKLEYQVAQREMLKLRHRIIPIVLEDISQKTSNIDPNLKAIIDSVTYIEWPGSDHSKKQHKFWERVRLSMPKTKRIEKRGYTRSYGSNGIAHISYARSDSEGHLEMSSSVNDNVKCNGNNFAYISLNHESMSSETDEINSDKDGTSSISSSVVSSNDITKQGNENLEFDGIKISSGDSSDKENENESNVWHTVNLNSVVVKL